MSMKKYFILYRIPVAILVEWRKNTDPKEMHAQAQELMDDMARCMETHAIISLNEERRWARPRA